MKKCKNVKLDERVSDLLYIIDLTVGKQIFRNAMVCNLHKKENKIMIGDILVTVNFDNQKYKRYINKGYGTLLMNQLLLFARQNNYEQIVGNLGIADENSEYDPDHRDRQIHFYKKFGFNILPNEKNAQYIKLFL